MDWGLLVGALLLAAVGIFIVWDSRSLRAAKPPPLSRDRMQKGFKPRGLSLWQGLIAMAFVSGFLGFGETLKPSLPPFTGRLSSLFTWAHALFGERGPAGVHFAAALGFAVAAYAAWRGRIAKV